ncbi:MAG: choice-of-anchor G family protein [Microbacteriaceae bacterium]
MRKTIGLMSLSALALLTVTVQGSSTTLASWQDSEYVYGSTETLNCVALDTADSTSWSKMLGGTLLSLNLDTLASVNGVRVTSDSSSTTFTPSSAIQSGDSPYGYAEPLRVDVLAGAIGVELSQILRLNLTTLVGIYGQYAMASPNGDARAGAGLITNNGGISLAIDSPDTEPPGFATLSLSGLLRSLTGNASATLVSGLADVSLEIGAVASYAEIDGCNANWQNNIYQNLERDYRVAGLNALLESPLLGQISTAVGNTVSGIQAQLNVQVGASGSGSLVSLLLSTLGALPVLSLGTPSASLTVGVNITPVTQLLLNEIVVGNDLAWINLSAGTIRVDLEKLLGPDYENSVGLNGHNANTQLLINEAALAHLFSEMNIALTGLANTIDTLMKAAYQVATISGTVSVPISVEVQLIPLVGPKVVVNAGALDININTASTTPVSISLNTSSCDNDPNTSAALCVAAALLINTTLGTVLVLLQNNILSLVTTLLGTISASAIQDLSTQLLGAGGIMNSIVQLLSLTLDSLFGEDAVLSLMVNAQNAPAPADTSSPPGALPGWAAGLAGPTSTPFSTGRYDISAIRLVGIGLLASGLALDLARSSVGTISITN